MKKVLSILMSVLIIALSFAFIAGAADGVCDCKDHNLSGSCHCCVYCDNLDIHYATACVKDGNGNLKSPLEFCCTECTGIYPCNCECDCCTLSDEDIADSEREPILTPDQQEAVVSTFQQVLSRVREFFDKIFDAIFEFLRFDEVMGNN